MSRPSKILSFIILALAMTASLTSCTSPRDVKSGLVALQTEETGDKGDTGEADAVAPRETFVFASGDEVKITVWRQEDLAKDTTVDAAGYISMPLVGKIYANGKTVDELTEQIALRLKPYYVDPKVDVTAGSVASRRYYVFGSVINQGKYTLVGHENVLDALLAAGGPDDEAYDKVLLIRREEKQVRIKRLTINASELGAGYLAVTATQMRNGDILYLPTSLISDFDSFLMHFSNLLNPLLNIEQGVILWPSLVRALKDEEKDVTVAL